METIVPLIDIQILDRPVGYVALGDGWGSEFLATSGVESGGGGECVFLGRTRGEEHSEHGALLRLRYEAYGPMAEGVLRELAVEAAGRFGCLLVRVHHAVGVVEIGEASVLVQVGCGHRGEAFEACRYLIDELKKRAPIWKKEEWADGTSWSEGAPGSPIPGSPIPGIPIPGKAVEEGS